MNLPHAERSRVSLAGSEKQANDIGRQRSGTERNIRGGNDMEHAHTPHCTDCELPARRYSGALLPFAIAGLLTACSGGGGGAAAAGSASSGAPGTVALEWEAAAGADAYRVYYGTSAGVYEQSFSVGNTTTYTLTNLGSGTRYFIAVAAVEWLGGSESDWSNEVSKIVP